MARLVVTLCLLLTLATPALADPNNQPWGDNWRGIKRLEPNNSVNSFFGPSDMTYVDGFRFTLPAKGDVTVTVRGPGQRFVYTVEIPGYANSAESRYRNPARWSHRDLPPGDYVVRVLWHDAVRQGPIPTTTYNVGLTYRPHGGAQAPSTGSPPPAAPQPSQPGQSGSDLLANGDFAQGVTGWQFGQSGYSGARRARGVTPADASAGCLRLGVTGGTQYALQKIRPADWRLLLTARFRVERWSTFSGGRPGGWAAVAVSFRGQGRGLATTFYYLNPHADSANRAGARWIKLGSALPVPTGWQQVQCDVAAEMERHGLSPSQVDELWISATVFGTHEDGTYTVACFDDFRLEPLGSGAPAATQPSPPPADAPTRLTAELEKIVGTKRFVSLKSGPAVVQFAWHQKELLMDVPGAGMTREQRYHFQRLFTDHDRVNYQGGWSYHVYFNRPAQAAEAGRRVLNEVFGLKDYRSLDWSTGTLP